MYFPRIKFDALRATQFVFPGNIIVRQRGTRFHPGDGVGMARSRPIAPAFISNSAFAGPSSHRRPHSQGKDHTIFATVSGNVRFKHDRHKDRKTIYIEEPALQSATA